MTFLTLVFLACLLIGTLGLFKTAGNMMKGCAIVILFFAGALLLLFLIEGELKSFHLQNFLLGMGILLGSLWWGAKLLTGK